MRQASYVRWRTDFVGVGLRAALPVIAWAMTPVEAEGSHTQRYGCLALPRRDIMQLAHP
jgi:hypothetical protein